LVVSAFVFASSAPIGETMITHWDYPSPFTRLRTPVPDDIDGLNHVNNAAYIRWCEDVAWGHSESLGIALRDYQRIDRAMAIRHAEYDYLLPALEGESLTLATWLVACDGRLTMERRFQLIRNADNVTLLRGRWELVCIEVSSGKVRRMPAEFITAYVPAVVALLQPDQLSC
jgi:acyl-CoA thioester hydrolase